VPIRTSPTLVVGALQALFRIEPGTLWSDPKPERRLARFRRLAGPDAVPRHHPAAGEPVPLTAVVNGIGEATRRPRTSVVRAPFEREPAGRARQADRGPLA
jgi:hypothetical protein